MNNSKSGRRWASWMIVAGMLTSWATGPIAANAASPSGDERILPADAALEELWNEGEFTEGAAVAPDGTVYFSDICRGETPGRVMKFDPQTGRTTVHCADSGKSNGLMFDRDGRLIACCGADGGKRALCEITPNGDVRVRLGQYQGKPFNAPNDLVIHPDGSIYFSDPRYLGQEPIDLDHMSVYRYVPATGQLTRETTDITKPNGVMCSPDGDTVYIAWTDNGSDGPDETAPPTRPQQMRLMACPRNADGTLGKPRVLVDFGDRTGVDGMALDRQGHIYAALRDEQRPGIAVFTPQGDEIAHIPTDTLPTNCCFGRGDEASTLYVTSGRGLYRIQLKIPGFHPATARAQ